MNVATHVQTLIFRIHGWIQGSWGLKGQHTPTDQTSRGGLVGTYTQRLQRMMYIYYTYPLSLPKPWIHS